MLSPLCWSRSPRCWGCTAPPWPPPPLQGPRGGTPGWPLEGGGALSEPTGGAEGGRKALSLSSLRPRWQRQLRSPRVPSCPLASPLSPGGAMGAKGCHGGSRLRCQLPPHPFSGSNPRPCPAGTEAGPARSSRVPPGPCPVSLPGRVPAVTPPGRVGADPIPEHLGVPRAEPGAAGVWGSKHRAWARSPSSPA